MINFRDKEYRCTSEIVLGLISGKWKISILNRLVKGPVRYNELRRELPEATQRMVTMQLRMLSFTAKSGILLVSTRRTTGPYAHDVMRFWNRLYRKLSR